MVKVFGMTTAFGGRKIVAAPNQKAAAEALGISLHHLRGYVSVTGNPVEIEAATASPGVALLARERGDKYEPCAKYDMGQNRAIY